MLEYTSTDPVSESTPRSQPRENSPGDVARPSGAVRAQQPLVLRALLAMVLASVLLQVAQVGLTIAQITQQSGVSWFSNRFEGWLYVVGSLFQSLLPMLLVVGVLGVWKQKSGARRLTILAVGTLVVFGVLELITGLVQLTTAPPRPLQTVESLISVGQSFLNRNGLLLLLVICLKKTGGPVTPLQPGRAEPADMP